jgi:hypothetical protein
MTKQRKTSGEIVDELTTNARRLNIVHCCLGVLAAFIYWVRPGTFRPHLPGRYGGAVGPAFSIVTNTFVAWVPYVISGFFSRAVLSLRDPKATLLFIGCSAGIAIGAASFYFNLFQMREAPSPLLISASVTVALMVAAGLCAAIWRK